MIRHSWFPVRGIPQDMGNIPRHGFRLSLPPLHETLRKFIQLSFGCSALNFSWKKLCGTSNGAKFPDIP
jgi:hypothetical protein